MRFVCQISISHPFPPRSSAQHANADCFGYRGKVWEWVKVFASFFIRLGCLHHPWVIGLGGNTISFFCHCNFTFSGCPYAANFFCLIIYYFVSIQMWFCRGWLSNNESWFTYRNDGSWWSRCCCPYPFLCVWHREIVSGTLRKTIACQFVDLTIFL